MAKKVPLRRYWKREELMEEVVFLTALGVPPYELARKLGMTVAGISKAAHKSGMLGLAREYDRLRARDSRVRVRSKRSLTA